MTTESPAGLALLRAAFPPHQISTLPKPYKRDSPKGKCSECGGFHGLPAVHLSYVGHAALTDRLLDADPAWTWEPLALGADGLPALDRNGGMWIRLTVLGVTRLGYGDAQGKTGGDAVKETIGDALRNAAMRFGAALDLWHKGDLHGPDDADADADAQSHHVEPKTRAVIKATDGAGASLDEDAKARMAEIALMMIEKDKSGDPQRAADIWYDDATFKDNDERVYLWSLLARESKLRAFVKDRNPRDQKRAA